MTPQRFDPKGRWKMCKKNSVFSTAKPQTLLQLTSIWKSLQISPAIPHLVFEMLLFFFECQHWPWQKSPHTHKKKHLLEVSTHPSPRWMDVLFFPKNDDSKVLKMFLFEVSGVPNSPAAIWISLTKVPLELRGKCWWPTLEDSNGETSSDFFWHRCHRSRTKRN